MNAACSPAAAPGSVNELPCQRDPDRWFDRRNRTDALTGCLACPARSWCARQALSDHATAGMWAGIWIDGNLVDVADYLQAIAEAAPPSTPPPPRTIHRTEPPRLPPVIRPPAKHTAAAVITARSSGHCEIMAADCLFALDAIASRIRGRCGREWPTQQPVTRSAKAARLRSRGWSRGYLSSSATLSPAPRTRLPSRSIGAKAAGCFWIRRAGHRRARSRGAAREVRVAVEAISGRVPATGTKWGREPLDVSSV
jgi:hypothetical protein